MVLYGQSWIYRGGVTAYPAESALQRNFTLALSIAAAPQKNDPRPQIWRRRSLEETEGGEIGARLSRRNPGPASAGAAAAPKIFATADATVEHQMRSGPAILASWEGIVSAARGSYEIRRNAFGGCEVFLTFANGDVRRQGRFSTEQQAQAWVESHRGWEMVRRFVAPLLPALAQKRSAASAV
jgi:hypothetical protein